MTTGTHSPEVLTFSSTMPSPQQPGHYPWVHSYGQRMFDTVCTVDAHQLRMLVVKTVVEFIIEVGLT